MESIEKEEKEDVKSINAWSSRYNSCKYFNKYNQVYVNAKSTFIPEYRDVYV